MSMEGPSHLMHIPYGNIKDGKIDSNYIKEKNYTKKVSLNIKEILRQAKMKNLSPPDHYRKNNVGNLTPDTRG